MECEHKLIQMVVTPAGDWRYYCNHCAIEICPCSENDIHPLKEHFNK